MNAKTKIEIECELLKAEHDVRHAENNRSALLFNATMAKTSAEKKAFEDGASYYASVKERAMKHKDSLNALLEAAAYHALSVRDNAIDRKWAAKLSAA